MAKRAVNFLIGVVCTGVSLIAGPSAAAEDGATSLVLRMDNYALVPAAILERAEQTVTRIYAAAGVEVIWVGDGGDALATWSGLRSVRVLLLADAMANRKIAFDAVADMVLGQAAAGSGRAYIFTSRVQDAGLKYGATFEALLGRVIAHEVGHVLLPYPSHSNTGIMKENLIVRTRRVETFTPREGELLLLSLR
jgi:hypothetical protein